MKNTKKSHNALFSMALGVLAVVAGLYAVMVVYASGEWLLAMLLLLLIAVGVWVFTSVKLYAWRYLYPGIAAALVFVVFPMIYTIATSFTNFSADHLVGRERAKQALLEDRYDQGGASYAVDFAKAGEQWIARLAAVEPPRPAATASAAASAPSTARFVSAPFAINTDRAQSVAVQAATDAAPTPALPMRELIAQLDTLRALSLTTPDGRVLTLKSLREFAAIRPQYRTDGDTALIDQATGKRFAANEKSGFFEASDGERLKPGFVVGTGIEHYRTLATDEKFSQPFWKIFLWTIGFAAFTVVFTTSLGMLLALLLDWPALRGRAVYRLILFLPYAVPGFISILIFKGLFNQNLGEVNLILKGLFGISPAWFSDPTLAKVMILIVNTWLGFPYMMIVCGGLIKSIPADLYEAAEMLGAGTWQKFKRITLPLIMKPLTPLLIAVFAFNFNNFVLINLLTDGRPDFIDTTAPAGTTDVLVSYTWRIAFQDSGQNFGLAAAISTVIFLLVAAMTLLQMRYSRIAEDDHR